MRWPFLLWRAAGELEEVVRWAGEAARSRYMTIMTPTYYSRKRWSNGTVPTLKCRRLNSTITQRNSVNWYLKELSINLLAFEKKKHITPKTFFQVPTVRRCGFIENKYINLTFIWIHQFLARFGSTDEDFFLFATTLVLFSWSLTYFTDLIN